MNMTMDLVLIGAAGFVLGICVGYGLRAYISARRRRLWRTERELPLHPSPLLAPDVERFRSDEAKPVR